MHIQKEDLCTFLVKAKKLTYAAGENAQKIKEKDLSTTIILEDGDWRYHDNYFGGEPYGGREVAFFHNIPVYMMVYYGYVEKTVADINAVYEILQGALRAIPTKKPFRGPEVFSQDGLIYKNVCEGEVDNFSGEEVIVNGDGHIIYRAKYIGGLIDQKR